MMRRLPGVLAAVILLAALPASASAAAPGNDLPAGATALGFPATIDQDTTEATVTTDDIGCGAGGQDQATVWYTLVVAAPTEVLVDARGADYQVGVNIYAGSATADALVACSDPGIIFDAAVGTTYYIMLADIDGEANGGHLLATVDVAPPPLELTVTIDPNAKPGLKGSSLVVTGTLSCDREADFGEVDAYVRQTVGRFVTHGSGFDLPACGPVPVAWAIEVPADNGKFNSGKTVVDVSAFACASFRCDDETLSVKVRVRR